MSKITGVIDRFEGQRAVVRSQSGEFIIPKTITPRLKEGQAVTITIIQTKNKLKKKTKSLITEIFRRNE